MISLGKKYRPYKIGIAIYKGKDGNFYGWADVGCGEKKTDSSFTKQTTGHCSISNYNDYFKNVKNKMVCYFLDYEGKYVGNTLGPNCFKAQAGKIDTSWTCPDKIYISKNQGADNMNIYFTESSCKNANPLGGCVSRALAQNASQKGGQPGKLIVNNYKINNEDTETQTVTDQARDEEYGSGDNDIEKIKQWGEDNKGQEGNYSLDQIGDGCGAISSEVSDLISTILWIIDIIAILILIIMTMINLIQAITGSDEEKFRDVFKHLRVRIIAVVLLLLLPVLVGGIIDLINDNAGGEVKVGADGKPFCDIEK